MRKLLLATALVIVLSASAAQAQSVYTVTLNTSSLAGHGNFRLDLQLIDGSGLSADLNNNTVTLSNFNFGTGGASLANGVPTNGAIGNLATGVTLQDSAFFNEYSESFTPGSSLSFTVTTTNVPNPGGTPDLFTFAVLDSNGNEIPTTGFANEFLSVSLEGGSAPKVSANTSAANTTYPLEAPSAVLNNGGGAPTAATIHVNAYTGVYDGNAHSATGSATGVNGEDLSSLLNLGASFTNVPGGTVHWTFAGNANYLPASGDASITITNATPTIHVTGYTGVYDGNPHGAAGSATGVNGEDLSSLLNLGASFTSVPGGTAHWTFAGNANYAPANGDVAITIARATPVVTWNNPADITYGTALGATQLNAVASVAGSLLYSPSSGTLLSAGMNQPLLASFTPTDATNYNSANKTVQINVLKGSSSIQVNGYTGVYDGNAHGATGTATGVSSEDLSSLLNFGATFTNVPGGTAHWTFAGDVNYAAASGDVSITIGKATPTITWNNPADITYGTALGAIQLNATASVAGSLLYSPSSGTLLSASLNQPLRASFTPTDATNYNSANKTVQINVLKGSSSIQVNGFTGVYDGNPHGATGTATGVNGEDLSSLLNLGALFTAVPGGTAHWTFPGNANYAGASGDVAIAITKATPAITWGNPAGIVYGTLLSATQLNAVASVAGSLLYSPSSGTLLSAGMNQPLLASFTPTDTTNYNSASKTVQINVLKATASFSNLTSPLIAFGTSTVNLAGKISLGSFIPTGSVAITLNGVSQTSAIQADGTFSSNFATTSLTPATPPYSIAYSYGGDGNFNPATGSGTLTVVYNIVPLYDQSQSHHSGSTIPIKLEVSNATGSNLSASNLIVTAVGISLISTTAYGPVVDSGNANPDSNFRFDSNTYIFNLKTTGLGTGVYNLYFRVGADPTLHTVQFQIQ
jgi:hypothetical protein